MARQGSPSDPRRAGRRVNTRDRTHRVPHRHGHLLPIMVVGGWGAPVAIVSKIAPTLCVMTHHRGKKTGDGMSPVSAANPQRQVPKNTCHCKQNSGLRAPGLKNTKKTSSVNHGVWGARKCAQMPKGVWWCGQRVRVKVNTKV